MLAALLLWRQVMRPYALRLYFIYFPRRGLHADAVGRVAARGPRALEAIVSARRGEQRVDLG